VTLTIAEARIRRLIAGAERVEAVTRALAADSNDAGRWVAAVSMYVESPTRQALLREMDGFTAAERCELVALMWLGRDDAGETAADWPALNAEARRVSPDGDVLLLVGRNLLSRYLAAGLDKLAGA
jgi:hypothetical protein